MFQTIELPQTMTKTMNLTNAGDDPIQHFPSKFTNSFCKLSYFRTAFYIANDSEKVKLSNSR